MCGAGMQLRRDGLVADAGETASVIGHSEKELSCLSQFTVVSGLCGCWALACPWSTWFMVWKGVTHKGTRNQGIRRPRCTSGFRALKIRWLIYYNTQNLELDYVSRDKTADSQEDFTLHVPSLDPLLVCTVRGVKKLRLCGFEF